MLQTQHLTTAPIAPLVASNQAALTPNLDVGRQNFDLRTTSCSQRCRVPVRPHSHAAFAIDHRKAPLYKLEPLFRQGQQMLTLKDHSLANALLTLSYPTLLIFSTTCQ